MLPAAARLRRRRDFTATLRGGRRSARDTLVVSRVRAGAEPADSAGTDAGADSAGTDAGGSQSAPARVGFIVGRAVGGSVTRHLVKRRLRHLMADRLDQLEPGDLVVVRALPGAATADFAALARDLDAALDRLLRARR